MSHSAPLPPDTIKGICELTLQTQDPEGLADFYCAALALPVLSREPDRIWLVCGERARLGLWSPGAKEHGDEGGSHVHFALAASPRGLDALKTRLEGLGIGHRGPVEHEGGDRSLYIEDPEGNIMEVWDYFERGEGARDGVWALM